VAVTEASSASVPKQGPTRASQYSLVSLPFHIPIRHSKSKLSVVQQILGDPAFLKIPPLSFDTASGKPKARGEMSRRGV